MLKFNAYIIRFLIINLAVFFIACTAKHDSCTMDIKRYKLQIFTGASLNKENSVIEKKILKTLIDSFKTGCNVYLTDRGSYVNFCFLSEKDRFKIPYIDETLPESQKKITSDDRKRVDDEINELYALSVNSIERCGEGDYYKKLIGKPSEKTLTFFLRPLSNDTTPIWSDNEPIHVFNKVEDLVKARNRKIDKMQGGIDEVLVFLIDNSNGQPQISQPSENGVENPTEPEPGAVKIPEKPVKTSRKIPQVQPVKQNDIKPILTFDNITGKFNLQLEKNPPLGSHFTYDFQIAIDPKYRRIVTHAVISLGKFPKRFNDSIYSSLINDLASPAESGISYYYVRVVVNNDNNIKSEIPDRLRESCVPPSGCRFRY